MKARSFGFYFVVVAILLAALPGCEDEQNQLSGPTGAPGRENLLGLTDGRALEYIEVDSSVSWFPSYRVTVDTGAQFLEIAKSGDDWIVSDSGTPFLTLRVSDPFVMNNGYRRTSGEEVTFLAPPVLMNRSVAVNDSWETDIPAFSSDSGQVRFPFAFTYFGFHVVKTYRGTEQIFVPAMAAKAHRYDVDLYVAASDSLPVATAVEYYADGTGLIRWQFFGDGFSRIWALREVR